MVVLIILKAKLFSSGSFCFVHSYLFSINILLLYILGSSLNFNTVVVGESPRDQAVLEHQVDFLQFSSTIPLWTWR